jgi:DNA polymerase-4
MRTILFIDPPAFCTTLEVLQDPQLRRRPVAIAPLAADRAVLLAVSAEARLAGVARGMAVALARRICPDLVVRPPDPARYARAHRALHAILAEVAPVIEPRGWGHAYLDLTGTERLFGPATEVARRLERSVRERLSLPLAVGVAINKLVSESAATVVKREAGADIWAVAPGYEAAFLAPEPVALLPEVPESVRRRLDDYHLDRIGEVAAIGETPLRVAFGAAGGVLHRHAHGIDPRPVLPPEVQAALRLTHELSTDTNDRHALANMLRPLAEEIGRRLRARRLMAGRLVVTVRHADDTTAERAVAVGASPLDAELWRAACRALDAALVRRVAVRSLVLTADGLHDGGGQLELWPATEFNVSPKAAALQQAVDRMKTVNGERGAADGRAG